MNSAPHQAPCPREPELLDALARGFLGPEMEEHAASCPECGEARTVAAAFLDEKEIAVAEAPVPSAGTMWWRVRLRERREAEERARRSLLVGQATTLVAAVALLLALFGGHIASGLRAAAEAARIGSSLPAGLAGALVVGVGLALALAVVVTPIAGWWTLRRR